MPSPTRPATAKGVVNIVGNTIGNLGASCRTVTGISYEFFTGRIERNTIVGVTPECALPTPRNLPAAILAKLQAAAMSRTDIAHGDRRPFYLYVDDFGALATRFFTSLLSEGRKFGISLVLANQFTSQIQDESIREAIFGNVATLVAFRSGHADAVRLANEFNPALAPRDFVNLPN